MDVSSPSSEGNVCIVCDDTSEYLVFVVNLKWKVGCKSDGIVTSTKVKPTVRLDIGSDEPAVCMMGSTLYWFDWNVTARDSKSMYTFQLPRDASNFKLNKGMMSEGPSMKGSKIDPRATPTPCGKILVFSLTIDVNDYDSSHCDFELYDPATGVWRKLPSILPLVDKTKVKHMYNFRIMPFTFMGKNVFVINTEVGVFNLDIKKRGATWKSGGFCGLGCPCAQYVGPSFVLIGKELCLSLEQAHDIHDVSSSFYTFPELSESSRGYDSLPSGGVVLLEENSENFSVCVVQFAVKEATEVAELLLQVYSCRNRTECMAKLSDYRLKNAEEPPKQPWERTSVELPATTKASSLRYVLEDLSLCLRSFFSIPPAPAFSRKSPRLNPARQG